MATLKFLSRYLFRTAITNKRIVSIKNGHVTFRYRPSDKPTERTMRLPVFRFMHRFLQHALPAPRPPLRLSVSSIKHRSRRTAQTDRHRPIDLRRQHGTRRMDRAENLPLNRLRPEMSDVGSLLIFERFTRLRPPPIELRSQHQTTPQAIGSDRPKHQPFQISPDHETTPPPRRLLFRTNINDRNTTRTENASLK